MNKAWAQAVDVLRQVEWIAVFDGEGKSYITCPACFADKALRGGHTMWCPLEQALTRANIESRRPA